MPLKKGTTKETISKNIRQLIREGYEADQAAAIAYDFAELAEKRPGPKSEAQTPAAPSERIEGSKKNPEGSASGQRGGIEISKTVEEALKNKIKEYKDKNPNAKFKPTLGQLKAVYRRGAGAFSSTHRPSQNRQSWSMARVNMFIKMIKGASVKESYKKADGDLLPKEHPSYQGSERSIMQEAFAPTKGMIEEALKGLEWRREFNRGGTEVGVARARDISNGKNLSLDTVKRMRSFFARHEVDKDAEGFKPGEEGFPSAGRIAHALWGGDAGKRWADNILQSRSELSEDTIDYEQLKSHLESILENYIKQN